MPMKNRGASCHHRGLIRGTQWSTQVWAPTLDSGDSGPIGPDIRMLSNFLLNFNILAMPHCMLDLVPWPGMEPLPPALEVWSLSHWTTREVLGMLFKCHQWFRSTPTWGPPGDSKMKVSHKHSGASTSIDVVLGYVNRNIDSKIKVTVFSCT